MIKDKYKLRNWHQYNEGLKKRGSLTLWISKEVLDHWLYKGDRKRGGKILYSDQCIDICLCIRKVYHLPLRQTEGFVTSLFERVGLKMNVPDYTTMCKRSACLSVDLCATGTGKNVTDIVVDSTGLKVYGEGEWKVRKHGKSKYRTWMKMHVAVDELSQQVEAVTLTTNAIDDAAEVKPLLKQIKKKIRSFKGDGGYDKSKARKNLYENDIQQVIPPQHNAVINKKGAVHLKQRDEAIKTIEEIGRIDWKKQSNYHQRSKAETTMFRYKIIIGNTLSSRILKNQKTEVRIGCKILNIFLNITKPESVKVC